MRGFDFDLFKRGSKFNFYGERWPLLRQRRKEHLKKQHITKEGIRSCVWSGPNMHHLTGQRKRYCDDRYPSVREVHVAVVAGKTQLRPCLVCSSTQLIMIQCISERRNRGSLLYMSKTLSLNVINIVCSILTLLLVKICTYPNRRTQ